MARSKTLRGKYEKAPHPILKTSSDLRNPFVGPGHNSVIEDSQGDLHAIYHAWVRDEVSLPQPLLLPLPPYLPLVPTLPLHLPLPLQDGEVDWERGRHHLNPSPSPSPSRIP